LYVCLRSVIHNENGPNTQLGWLQEQLGLWSGGGINYGKSLLERIT